MAVGSDREPSRLVSDCDESRRLTLPSLRILGVEMQKPEEVKVKNHPSLESLLSL